VTYALLTSAIAQNCSINYELKLKLPGCGLPNGEISSLNLQGGDPPYSFQLNQHKNDHGKFTGLKLQVYQIVIRDAGSCVDTAEVSLIPDPNTKYFNLPNAFSPNGDGINDVLIIHGIEKYRAVHFSLYNKWGQELFSLDDYSNDYPWDGTQNGRKLHEGTYYYIINFLQSCRDVYQRGSISIVRWDW